MKRESPWGTHADADTDPGCDHWTLATRSGLSVCVPPSFRSLITHVVLEQEGWCEAEMGLLPRLLKRGMNGLDIGAGHGLYTLEMARCAPGGHVWSFEASAAARALLQRSVQCNAWDARVTVVAAAMAEVPGHGRVRAAAVSTPGGEQGAVDGPAALAGWDGGEPLRVETLDHYMDHHLRRSQDLQGPGATIDFVRIGAGSDTLGVLVGGQRFFEMHSPVVLFGLRAGQSLSPALMACWQALGFDLFCWRAELALLLPFEGVTEGSPAPMNLVAVRPEEQARLALRGLLLSAGEGWLRCVPQTDPRVLNLWFSRPALPSVDSALHSGEMTADNADLAPYLQALTAVAAAHFQPRLSPAQRLGLMMSVRQQLLPGLDSRQGQMPEVRALLVHGLYALGETQAAVHCARQLLARWPAPDALKLPVAPPAVADLQRPRSTPIGPWLRQMLAEFVALREQPSSGLEPPAPARWAALLAHPDHGAEIERRYLLSYLAQGRMAPLDLLHSLKRLPSPVHTCNPLLWQALLQASRAMTAGTAGGKPRGSEQHRAV